MTSSFMEEVRLIATGEADAYGEQVSKMAKALLTVYNITKVTNWDCSSSHGEGRVEIMEKIRNAIEQVTRDE